MVLLNLAATAAYEIMSQANDRLFALLATVLVVIGVLTGFWLLGSPNRQRQIRLDQQRLNDLFQIALYLHQQAEQSLLRDKTVNLPTSLSANNRQTDPISNQPYQYRRLDNTKYQLCAEFATESDTDKLRDFSSTNQDFWQHPSGRHCFQLDVLENPPQPQ